MREAPGGNLDLIRYTRSVARLRLERHGYLQPAPCLLLSVFRQCSFAAGAVGKAFRSPLACSAAGFDMCSEVTLDVGLRAVGLALY